ncbi:hemagglutinin repeat-containing protein [Xanthomonas euvesicatoria]
MEQEIATGHERCQWLRNVELNATNTLSNQGVIAGADVSVTAGNLLNQGRISGTGTVALEARNDLLNQGQIQGRDVALAAGNNLVSEAPRAINGAGILSGISASNALQMMAGNDMTLTGTRVQAGGSAALIAGNNLSLTPSALRDDNGLLRGGDAVSVTTGKDLIVSAGKDLQLHGVTIAAGGSAALQAGNNLSLTPTTGLDGKVATRTNISTGDSLQLTAGNDLTIRQAEVKEGGDLIAAAGNNLNVESVLNETETNSYNSRNGKTRVTTTTATQTIDQQALTAGGNLILSAGNDVNLVAAKLDAGKGLGISAGNDINASTLTTVDTSDVLETRKRFKQTTATRDETVHGTEFSAGGNLAMQAGNDITLTAASAATKEGGITLAAGNDVNLLAASEQHDAVQDMTKKKKGTFSSKTTTTHDEWHDNVAVTTTLSGDTVQIAAGNDLLSQGAQVASTGDVVLAAGNNLTLDTVQNTHSEEHEKTVKKSGLYGGGGFSVALGVTKKTDGLDVTEVTNTGSLVGSTDGSVTMTAGNKVAITGSDVLSAASTTIVGREVTIAAAENTVDTVQTSKQQSAGITLGLTGAAVEAAQAAYMATKRGSEVEDDRLKALYAAKTAYAVSDAVSAYQAPPTSGGQDAVSLKIALGASSASSKTTTHDETTGGSRILSDGNVTIAATDGDLNVIGSQINGQNVTLAAANNLNLLSNKETNTSKSENKNGGGEIGVSVGTTTGFYVSAYAGKGNAKGNSELHTESVVTAKDTLTLASGNDTTIKGAQVIGDTVLAKIGGDLLIQSEQDTEDYKSKQQQAGVKLVYGVSGSSASYSQQKVNSSYSSVNEQSGIQAGNGGFDITVGGNTHLIGGAIASTADAALNYLSTGSLTVEDLQNKAEYKAGGFGVGTGDWQSVAAGAALSLAGNQTGSSGSTTKSDIAAGSVEVRNGDSTALAGLDRSATELQQSGLKQIFDEKEVAEQQELAQVAGEVAFRSAKELISYKREQAAADAEQAMADLEAAKGDPDATATAKARLLAANDQLAKWNDAGAAKQITQVTAGALAAAVSGGNVLSAAGGVLMNETLLPKFADALQKGGIQPGSGAEATLMGGLGVLLGAAGGLLGGDVQAGAASGNAVQTYGYYDYREGRAQRQEMAAEALKNVGITDPNDVAGVNALLDNCVKLGCDPDKLVLLLKSPDAASTLRELAQPESVAFQRYGKGFNELDEQQRKDVINHIPTGEVSVGAIEKTPVGTVTVGAVGSTHADGTAASNSEGANNSQGIADSQQSQDENLRLKGATVVSNLAIAGGKKVEQFKNWLGEDNAETAALVLMAATGGPVKTLGSTLWAATPMAGYLQEKKEQYLVNPLTPLIGTNAFGAVTDSDQQAVQPASHATSSMLVDTLLSSLGVIGTDLPPLSRTS